MMKSRKYVEIGGWWHKKKGTVDDASENEIDIVAVTPAGQVHAFEVKRNRKKYSEELLKSQAVEMSRQSFGGADVICSGLSLEDM